MKDINFLIIEKLTAKLTKEEEEYLNDWVNESESNKSYYKSVKEIVRSGNKFDNRFDSDQAFEKFCKKHKVSRILETKFLMKYAAIFLILISVSFLGYDYWENREMPLDQYSECVTKYAQKETVILEDGTRVEINAGSKLRYPTKFKGKYRRVLLEGEAFFYVTKNSEHPFIVKTKNFDIEVLGTSFNVSSYSDDLYATTSLLEGKVKVKLKNKQSFIIKPNQKISYNPKDDKINLVDFEVAKNIQWFNNVLVFKNNDFNYIRKKIERAYGVKINLKNVSTTNQFLTATFANKTINKIMDILSKICSCQYKINGKEITMYN
jgi:ferric-dicitrate binding protein FerR (iron transport regulator)